MKSFAFLIIIDLSGFSIPKLIDIDSDGDLDLFTGEMDGNISFYINQGNSHEHNFALVTDNYFNISTNGRSSPEFIDMDIDGDFDLILGSQLDGLIYLENLGDNYNADFVPISPNNFKKINIEEKQKKRNINQVTSIEKELKKITNSLKLIKLRINSFKYFKINAYFINKILFFNFKAYDGNCELGVFIKNSSSPPFFSTILIVLTATRNLILPFSLSLIKEIV